MRWTTVFLDDCYEVECGGMMGVVGGEGVPRRIDTHSRACIHTHTHTYTHTHAHATTPPAPPQVWDSGFISIPYNFKIEELSNIVRMLQSGQQVCSSSIDMDG